jgi:hypothetical protein
MKKCLLIILFIGIALFSSKGQTVESIIGMPSDYMFRPASIRNCQLFDTEEIKIRKIKSCTITKSFYNNNTSNYKTDTVSICFFDTTGSLNYKIHYREYSNEKDTFNYSSGASHFYKRIDSTITITNGIKTVESYYIWDFNWEKPELIDTGIVVRRVYDDKNRLIEWKSNGTPDYHDIFSCGTGITFHYKYRYGTNSKIVFYDDVRYRYYATYKHTYRGVAVQVLNKEVVEKPRKYFVKVKMNNTTTVENDGDWIATMKYLNNRSKLFEELSNQQTQKGFAPTIYRFSYQYESQSENQVNTNSIVSN